MKSITLKHRVIYADTDFSGLVYHARFLEWMERGRGELLRSCGKTVLEFEKQGYVAPIVHLEIDYHEPAYYDDVISVTTKLDSIGKTSLTFSYDIKKGKKSIAQAKTVNVFIKRGKGKVAVPTKIRSILK